MLMGDNRLPMIVLPQAQTIRMSDIVLQITPLKVVSMVVSFDAIDMIDGIPVLESLAERKRDKPVNGDIVCVFCANFFKANANISIVPSNSFADDAAMRANPAKVADLAAIFKTGYRNPIFAHDAAPSADLISSGEAAASIAVCMSAYLMRIAARADSASVAL